MNKNTQKSDYSKGSISRNILRLAIPIIMAEFVHILYNLVDRMYIGHIEGGTEALTGLGLVLPLITMTGAFANIIVTGGTPLCAIARGEGNDRKAQDIQETAFTLLLILAAFLTVFYMLLKKPLIMMLGGDESTLPYALDYFKIYLLGTAFSMISLGMNASINMQGFPGIGMGTILVGAVANIILDPLFIFTFDMGIRGAAIATVLSQMLSCSWVLLFFFGKKAILPIRKLRLDKQYLKKILTLGFSGFCFKITNSITQAVVNISLKAWGGLLSTYYIGSMSIINSLRELLYMPVFGVADATKPVLGFNYGAGEQERMKKCVRFMGLVCFGMASCMYAVVHLFPGALIRIFTADEKLIEICIPCLHRYFALYFCMAFQTTGQAVYVALNKAKYATFFAVFRKMLLILPFTLLLPVIGFGINGVFWAEAISDIVGGGCCILTMLRVFRRTLQEMKPAKQAELADGVSA